MRKTIWLFLSIILSINGYSQNTTIEGYVFEDGNRGYLNLVEVQIIDENSKKLLINTLTDQNGFFKAEVPTGKKYLLIANKDLFDTQRVKVLTKRKDKNKKVFTKIKMQRQPGYIFDVTLAEIMQAGQEEVDAITGAKIEVFNNTTKKSVLELLDHPKPTFKVSFERGNHYTVMIRKPGYFTKRLEAYVDVKGCILCFEGVGNVQPGVSDVLTDGNKMGTLLANIGMRSIRVNQHVKLENVSFKTGGSELTELAEKELDKLTLVVKDNADLTFEISAHSDARGADDYNLQLSQQRAESIKNYLLSTFQIQSEQLIAKGYGETQLVNGCKNDVVCTDELHQQNRRAEWKVLRQANKPIAQQHSLEKILEIEAFNDALVGIDQQEQLVVKAGDALPPGLAEDVKNYGIDTKRIDTEANPEGVTLTEEIAPKEAHAHVTNATRLAEENYGQVTEREVMKNQQIPTAYQPPYVENFTNTKPKNRPIENTTATAYEEASQTRQILRSNEFGETVVAYSIKEKGKTLPVPINYTGYKVEFLTSMVELEATHKIFSQHGNIAMEQKENGVHSYLLGSYRDQKEAQLFLKEIMLPRYPNANLVYFSNGKRGRKVAANNKSKTKSISTPPR